MIQNDTVKLLRECDAGTRMGIASLDDVMDRVQADPLRQRLNRSRAEHSALEERIRGLLEQYQDDGKEPNPIAKGMSWMKTTMKMGMDESDNTIADLMTDGCNMGIKSLCRYLNQYPAADETSKGIARELIELEEHLREDVRAYL